MKSLKNTAYSVLELAPILQNGDAARAFRDALELARHVERLGFTRFWLAEHHNISGVASSATAVLIAYIAGGTDRIRVGSGGIMLPNHSPLIVAEQFGTLASLYPGRIDLGLGRAPGSDPATARALRRDLNSRGDEFDVLLAELRGYLEPVSAGRQVRAIPGEGMDIPIYLLGSSLYSAQLAAHLGLPFAFASHFAPNYLQQALQLYRDRFRPSAVLSEPYVMVGVNILAADTDDEAEYLSSSMKLRVLGLLRGDIGPLEPPRRDVDAQWTPLEKERVRAFLKTSAIGGRQTVLSELQNLLDQTEANEMIVVTNVFDRDARLRSHSLLADWVKT